MTIADFLTDLRRRDVMLWLDGDRLRCQAPKDVLNPELRAALAERKAEIISSLRAATERSHTVIPALVPVPRTGRMPLSFGQQRLWFLHQMDPESSVYHIAESMLISDFDPVLLQQAVTEVARRHETLRTTIQVDDGQPYQVVGPPGPVDLPRVDLRGLEPAAAAAEAGRVKAELVRTPFDLARGPLFRLLLLQHSDTSFQLLMVQHHIVTDGWSLALFYSEVGQIYTGLVTGKPAQLPPLSIQYADFAHWERQLAQTDYVKRQVEYWRSKLEGIPVLDLPTDRPRPATQTFRGALQMFSLSKQRSDMAAALARSDGVTLHMVLLTAFSVLLSKYSGQRDLAIGTSNGNRSRTELEHVIGFFVNTQVLRIGIGEDPTLREVLKAVSAVCLEAYSHQDVTFEKLVEVLATKRDLSRSPIFDVMFILQNTKLESLARATSLRSRQLSVQAAHLSAAGAVGFDTQMSSEGSGARLIVETGISKFDLTLYLMETDGGIGGSMEYNTDLFDHATVTRMLDHLEMVIDALTSQPDRRLSSLSLLTPTERKRLRAWQGPALTYARSATVGQLVAAQAVVRPDAVAVSGTGPSVTYRALMVRRDQIAARLKTLGVGVGDRVGVCVERTPALVAALLGIWETGAAYVPLDPAFPLDRLAYMVRDAAVGVVISDGASLAAVPAGAVTVLRLDVPEDWSAPAATSGEPTAGPGDVAYVIYTSGSTGWPKGVEVPHRAVVNFLTSMAATPGLTGADVLLAVTTLSFDIAGLELWLPLTVGARVEIATREDASDGEALLARLQTSGATVLQATPATWRLLLDAGWTNPSGVRMLCGGEALPRELADQLIAGGGALWNLYGPTETTIWSTVEAVQAGDEPIAIGRPIGNTQVYVLDDAGQPVPVGVPGELHIGGDGVALGYRGRASLTAEKFVPDPYAEVPGARMYRTGDMARWRPDGRLQCLGRIDHQVKVRGFRIELGEIETALAAQPTVQHAVVTVHPDLSGEQRLVAYVIAAHGASPVVTELRSALRERLPDYMVPSVFQFMAAFPLTPNGKIDRQALPAPDRARPGPDATYVVPRNGLEQSLAIVWQEVLGLETVGVFDNFFDLGGHSLLLVKAHSRLREIVPRRLSIVDMFRYPTIDALSRFLNDTPATDAAGMADVLARADQRMQAARQRARQPRRGSA